MVVACAVNRPQIVFNAGIDVLVLRWLLDLKGDEFYINVKFQF
jgi:hypothetical protein